MEYIINVTKAPSPPMHSHQGEYEIILYTDGEGTMHAAGRDYPVSEGSIFIVPPGVGHGSVGADIERIYVRGDFRQAFSFREPVLIRDNERREGTRLARLLYDNRFGNGEYLHALCTAYVQFLLMHMEIEDSMGQAVGDVIRQMTHAYSDPDLSAGQLLRQSGYAEDYIRAHFRRITGKTPVEFLTDVRIRHACFLLEFHGSALSLSQIAEQCGYTDYVYFSKKFKSVTGLSPRAYHTALQTGALV